MVKIPSDEIKTKEIHNNEALKLHWNPVALKNIRSQKRTFVKISTNEKYNKTPPRFIVAYEYFPTVALIIDHLSGSISLE